MANAWVAIAGVKVLFKVVNGPRGLFVAPPATALRGPDGKTRYLARVRWDDEDLRHEVEKGVLAAYRNKLDRNGGCEPDPKPSPPNPQSRMKAIVERAASMIDTDKAAVVLVDGLSEILNDPAVSRYDNREAFKMLSRIFVADRERDIAHLRALTRLRSEAN